MKTNNEMEMKDRTYSVEQMDSLEEMLHALYPAEPVPQDVKIRLQNRLMCQRVMETESVSFWWLPATVMTVVCFAMAVLFIMSYALLNINGDVTWMPNLLQRVSEFWLKANLVMLGVEVFASWLFTIIGVWKGNLVKSAKLL